MITSMATRRTIMAESSRHEYRKFIAVMVFIFLTATLMSTLISFRWLDWLRWFIGATMLLFGGCKLISSESFLDVFPRYNALANRFSWYAFVYPIVEVVLGICFILDIAPSFRAWIVLFMAASSLASMVVNLLAKGPTSKTTWLGTLLKLPMSTAMLFEDGILTVTVGIWIIGTLIFGH